MVKHTAGVDAEKDFREVLFQRDTDAKSDHARPKNLDMVVEYFKTAKEARAVAEQDISE